MTNQTIPPCPVCRKAPIKMHSVVDGEYLTPQCSHVTDRDNVSTLQWLTDASIILGRACREFSIETVEQLKARLAPDPRVAVLEKKLAKLTDKLAMVEQESEQRLSAIIGYSDQLLAMKEKYEPVPQNEPHPDGCFSSDPNDVTDCESDGHYSCKDCKRNSRIAAQHGEVEG